MTAKPCVAVLAWLPNGTLPQWRTAFPGVEFVEGDADLGRATITYGLPPVARLAEMPALRWVQLTSAGVPQDLCPPCRERGITVTNLAGLYGPSIAEHALGLMTMLARNLHVVVRNQLQKTWDRGVMHGMFDLRGRTLGVVGLGNIGQNIARLAQAYGMRVVGVRRRAQPTPYVDQVYPLNDLLGMLGEADVLAVAAPLTAHTAGLLGPAEFAALKRGVLYVNVARGGVAQEPALLEALTTGRVAAAGLDVYAVEPLAPDHPFWALPNVVVGPHYCGETVNPSSRPAERFARSLHAWLHGETPEGVVDLEWGY